METNEFKSDLAKITNLAKTEQCSPEMLFRLFLNSLGVNTTTEHTSDTPKRVVSMYRELLEAQGSDEPNFDFTTFQTTSTNLIVQSNIRFHTLCSHHMLPFHGVAHIAYLPDQKICGLSKLPRTVEWFAHKLQVQEILTEEVADFLVAQLSPKGVAVVLSGRHMCMEMRGVKSPCATTTTSALRGEFLTDQSLRNEFFTLLNIGQFSATDNL